MPERSLGPEMKPQSAAVKLKTFTCQSQKLGFNISGSFARHGLHIWTACNERFCKMAQQIHVNQCPWLNSHSGLKYFERTGFLRGHPKTINQNAIVGFLKTWGAPKPCAVPPVFQKTSSDIISITTFWIISHYDPNIVDMFQALL